MVLSKSSALVVPDTCNVLIIGAGATGSSIFIKLVKLGFTNLIVYDADIVEAKNVNNQEYHHKHIGMFKTDALYDLAISINDSFKGKMFNKYFTGNESGSIFRNTIIFLCVDKGRKDIVDNIKYCSLLIETRIGRDESAVYSTNFDKESSLYKNWYDTLPFKEQEETIDKSELSPCGETISLYPCVSITASVAVLKAIEFIRNKKVENNTTLINYFPNLNTINY